MGHIIAFVSVKGGVGKTTLALETASALANNYGKRVLLVDANFSAPNIGLYLDLTHEQGLHDVLEDGRRLHTTIYESHGFDVVPASLDYPKSVDVFKLKKVLERVNERYDFIIIDSAPNYEELKPVMAAAEKIFVVSGPDRVCLRTSMKAAGLAKENQSAIEGIIVNRIRSPAHEMNINEIESESGIPVVAKIKEHKKMAEALYNKKPITVHDSGNVISKEISRFASALCGTPEKAGFFQKFLPVSFFEKVMGKDKINRELMRQKFYISQL